MVFLFWLFFLSLSRSYSPIKLSWTFLSLSICPNKWLEPNLYESISRILLYITKEATLTQSYITLLIWSVQV